MPTEPVVACFSMEIALEPDCPRIAVVSGYSPAIPLRAAADLGIPMVAVTLVHRLGYFRQHLDADGNQTESADPWSPEDKLEPVATTASIVS